MDAGEDQRAGLGLHEDRQVLAQRRDDRARDANDAAARLGLGRPEQDFALALVAFALVLCLTTASHVPGLIVETGCPCL